MGGAIIMGGGGGGRGSGGAIIPWGGGPRIIGILGPPGLCRMCGINAGLIIGGSLTPGVIAGPTNAGGGGPTKVAALASKVCWTCR